MRGRLLLALRIARWVLELVKLAIGVAQSAIDLLVEWLERPDDD